MKTIIIPVGLALLPCALLADIPVGRGSISTSVTASATYDSNVFGQHIAVDDYLGTLAPEITYTRKAATIETDAHAKISFIRYLEQNQLDTSNWDTGASFNIPKSDIRNYSGKLSASYVEYTDVNADINQRIDTRTGSLIAEADLITGPRSDVALNGVYSDTRPSVGSDQKFLTTQGIYSYKDFFNGNTLHLTGEYERLRSSGDNTLGVPLNQRSLMLSAGLERAFVDNTLHVGVSYGYRALHRSEAETGAGTGTSQEGGSVFTVTLDGPFLPEKYFPKITSKLMLSYEDTATPGINDPGTKELTGAMLLSWQARPATTVTFSVHRNQRLSVDDLTVNSTTIQLGVEQTLRYNLTGSLSASYDWSTYRTIHRDDETAALHAQLTYHFARVWDANLAYSLNSTSSTVVQSTFDRHIVNLSVTYRF